MYRCIIVYVYLGRHLHKYGRADLHHSGAWWYHGVAGNCWKKIPQPINLNNKYLFSSRISYGTVDLLIDIPFKTYSFYGATFLQILSKVCVEEHHYACVGLRTLICQARLVTDGYCQLMHLRQYSCTRPMPYPLPLRAGRGSWVQSNREQCVWQVFKSITWV